MTSCGGGNGSSVYESKHKHSNMFATWCNPGSYSKSWESGELSPCISPSKERSPEWTTSFLQMKNMASVNLDTAWVSWGITCTISQRKRVCDGHRGREWYRTPFLYMHKKEQRTRSTCLRLTMRNQPKNDHFCIR